MASSTPSPPKPIELSPNGGLILARSLAAVGPEAASDLLDVDWTSDVLGSRDGAEKLTAEAGEDNYESLFGHSDSYLLVTRNGVLTAISAATKKEIAESTTLEKGIHPSYVRLGTPADGYTYIADSHNPLQRFDGEEFTTPTATVDGESGKEMPKGAFLTGWPDEENRLVVAGTTAGASGPGGADSNQSYIWFSDPGDAESFESTAFVRLDPGAGNSELLGGCCTWNRKVFVFKERRLFVFYGVSADSEGKPIFNFQTVDLGTRVPSANLVGQLVAPGVEGVYFVTEDGLWVTTGGEPTLLSDDLRPLSSSDELVGPAETTFGGLRWSDARDVAFHQDAVYVGLGEESITRVLKLDLETMRWTLFSADLTAMAVWTEPGTLFTRLFFTSAAEGVKHVCFYTPAADEDPTVLMDPRWQSGFYDLGNSDEKTFVNAKMWGTGKVDLKVAEDFGALGDATTFELGEAPAIAQCQRQKGQTATLFSHAFSGSAPWSVHRLDRYLRETRAPETEKA